MATAQVDQTFDAEGNLRSVRTVVTFDPLDDPESRKDATLQALTLARVIRNDDPDAKP